MAVVAVIPLFVGVIFLCIGIQTCRGTSPDVLGNGIGSIGIGVLMSSLGSEKFSGTQMLIALFPLVLLGLAGVFALGNRRRYLQWKRTDGGRWPDKKSG